MNLSCVVVLLSVFLFAKHVLAQNTTEKSFATSVAGMEQLLFTEKHLIDAVDKFTEELQAKVNALNNLISDLRTENQKAITNPEQYLYNPLNGYALIRRMHHDWPNIEVFMHNPVGESHIKVLQTYRPTMSTSRDLHEASEAIDRLYITYGLKAKDMAAGILGGKQHGATLRSIDCFSMASHLFGMARYYDAEFWILSAIESYIGSDYMQIMGVGKEKLWSLHAEILLQQNRMQDAVDSIKIASDLQPQDARITKRKIDIELQAKISKEPPIEYLNLPPSPYQVGCRGGFASLPSRMHCLYNTTTSPFLRLAPIKMEILQLEPFVVLYHDVLSDSEIEHLQDLAKPILERATVYNEEDKTYEAADERTSKFSWFPDETSNITLRINRRIMDMTGFDVKGSEMLQVMNYGIGGHYDVHVDFFEEEYAAEMVSEDGDRMATVLFYLSDVEQGGATVFPEIKKAVFPRKGSAVVFYNLNNRLDCDWDTAHAACPVLYGSKWVCNKWIRSKAQIFRKPCYK